jgi:HlyD family secretion protein
VQDNVVNYTVVVSADNSKGMLMPGMTARVNFLTSAARNVLIVPNAALRFHPATTTVTAGTTPKAPGGWSHHQQQQPAASLYYLDPNGKLASIKVQTGITDGSVTQVSGNGLNEGMQVITGSASASAQTAQTSATPFQSGQQQRGPRGAF